MQITPHAEKFRRVAVVGSLAAMLVLTLSASALAISRVEILRRAEGWIRINVPYSQSRWATLEGSLIPTGTPFASTRGWRTDCSGFVSMSLNLTTTAGTPRSLDTASLPNVMVKTTKADLKPGDFIIRPKTAVRSGHVVIFARWIDAKHTRYVGYHQRGTAYGAVANEITYPYGTAEGYSPYRYRGIDGERLRRSLLWRGTVSTTVTK